MSDRVRINTGSNKGKMATVIRELPEAGRTLVYLDGAANYDGLRAYVPQSLDRVSSPEPPAPPPPPPPSPPSTPYRFNTIVLDEQFHTLDTSRWGVYTSPGNHASEPGERALEAVTVSNGHLVITARNATSKVQNNGVWGEWINNGRRFAEAGKVITGAISHRVNYNRGRWECRVRTDPDPSLTMSGVVLLWPEGSMRPGDGEIDFYETTHKGARKPCYSFVHYAGSQNLQKYFKYDDIDAAVWHTWGCEWTPEYVRIYCDDRLVGETTDRAAIPTWSQGLHICVQYDAFGKRPITPSRMECDSVRVYQ